MATSISNSYMTSTPSKTLRPSHSPTYRSTTGYPAAGGYAYESDVRVPQLNSYTWPTNTTSSGVSHEQSPKTKNPKYRTKPCLNYMRGQCIFGDKCDFVHIDGAHQVPYSPSPRQERRGSSDRPDPERVIVPPRSADPIPRSPTTPPSYHRKDSRSHRGGPVTVVHVPVYVPAPPIIPMFEQATIDKMANRARSASIGNVNTNQPTFKTRHCKYFNQEGYCPKGESCSFIHDPNLARRASASQQNTSPTYNHTSDGTQPTWRVLGGGVLIREAHERSPEPCRDYLSGRCYAGEDCEYTHPPLKQSTSSRDYHDNSSSRRGSVPEKLKLSSRSTSKPPQSAPPTKTSFHISDRNNDRYDRSHPGKSKSNPTTPIKECSELPMFPAES